MSRSARTRALYGLNLFLGLTAVAGGVALLTGLIKIPVSALAGSPFSDFTVPAILLAVIIGGPSLLAAWLVHLNLDLGAQVSAVSGGAIVIFEIVEWNIIGFVWLQAVYIGVGAAIVALAAWTQMEQLLESVQPQEHGHPAH
ncbi:MAG: hypothetical protein WCB51_10840 [Candidatus Dormiibacterota bacterium]